MSYDLVVVLLSTYTGSEFIQELLESIHYQGNRCWSLVARDDGSTDATLSILNNFSACFPDKVTVLNGDGPRLGPSASFVCCKSFLACY